MMAMTGYVSLGFTIAYGIGLIGVGFIGSVIWYELSGGTGPYRTLTNQLRYVNDVYLKVLPHF